MGELTGTTFAGLEVRDAIGRDLVSTVYEAVEPDEERAVALRVVAEDLCAGEGEDRELYQRFLRRAGAALTFDHPNAPMVEEVGEHRGRGYLVTPHVDTVPFDDYVAQHGPLEFERAVALFAQVADVLDAGHRAGLTHGALNPTTLRVTTPLDGPPTVQLIGFGIGALIELRLRRDRKHLRDVEELLYVAPEQLRRQPLTGRTDQYAMACALVHALTGAPPSVRDTVGGLFGAHLFVTPTIPGGDAAEAAILKALAKEPRDRYATCTQLVSDVTRAGRSAANRKRSDRRRREAVAHAWLTSPGDATAVEPPAPAPTSMNEHSRAIPLPASVASWRMAEKSGTAIGEGVGSADASAAASEREGPVARDDDQPTPNATAGDRDPTVSGVDGSTRADSALSNGERPAPTGAHAEAVPVEDSSTARRQSADMTYPAPGDEPEPAPVTETAEDLDDVPLLSEVLSRRPHAEPAARRPSAVLLGLIILAAIATAIALWLIAS